jgi:GH15 family glucan-1,4-alpha-glucosidase
MNATATVIGNSRLLINLDYQGGIKDVYFPNIGQENQLAKYINPLYFFFEGKLIYPNSKEFEISIDYINDTLCSETIIKHNSQAWQVKIIDLIDQTNDIHYRDIVVSNLSDKPLDLIVYFAHNYSLLESPYADTVIWYQPQGVMWHYKKDRHIAFGLVNDLYQFSCAAKSDNRDQGVMPDENGQLDLNPVSTGNVTSVLSLKAELMGHKTKKYRLFYAYATTPDKVFKLVLHARKTNTSYTLQKQAIANSLELDALFNIKDFSLLGKIFNESELASIIHYFKRSILILKSQINHNGAVIAGNDGQFLKDDGTDHYSYLWPRDAALVARSFLKIHDNETFIKIMDHTLGLLAKEGYFYHKYLPSASKHNLLLGSSWHSYITPQGDEILPIQQDATLFWALVILEFFNSQQAKKSSYSKYRVVFKKIIKFILKFSCKTESKRSNIKKYLSGATNLEPLWFTDLTNTDLPEPSFDIWEQYYGVFSLNALLKFKVLKESYELFNKFDEIKMSAEILKVLNPLKEQINLQLGAGNGIISKGIRFDKEMNAVIKDESADSSLYLLYDLDLHKEFNLEPTLNFLDSKLFLQTQLGGIARKENDHYLKINNKIPGNPWFISSMWRLRVALKNNDQDFAKRILLWSISHFDKTGLIAEQMDPDSGFALGMKPLSWSHAEYLMSVTAFIEHLRR